MRRTRGPVPQCGAGLFFLSKAQGWPLRTACFWDKHSRQVDPVFHRVHYSELVRETQLAHKFPFETEELAVEWPALLECASPNCDPQCCSMRCGGRCGSRESTGAAATSRVPCCYSGCVQQVFANRKRRERQARVPFQKYCLKYLFDAKPGASLSARAAAIRQSSSSRSCSARCRVSLSCPRASQPAFHEDRRSSGYVPRRSW